MSVLPPPPGAWILSSWPQGSTPKSVNLQHAYGKLPMPAHWEVARYMEPSGPLSWEDIKADRSIDLSNYMEPQEWPRLSQVLRGLIVKAGQEKHMPQDITYDLWQQIIDKWIATHPPGSRATSRTSSFDSENTQSTSLSASKVAATKHQVIVYRGRMKVEGNKADGKMESIKLEPPTMDLACRYYVDEQFGGADRFIRVHIDVEDQWNIRNVKAQKAFEKKSKHGLWVGRYKYRPFISKDHNLFLYCERGPNLLPVELHEFVDHYIPFALNRNMSLDKWAARFHLGLSKIVPTAIFGTSQVRRVPNIYSNSLPMGRMRMRKIITMMLMGSDTGELPYTPSAICGKARGMVLYWKLSHDPELTDDQTDYMYLPQDLKPPASPTKIFFKVLRLDGTEMKSTLSGTSSIDFRYTDQPWQGEGVDMTDGHGLMSEEAAMQISAELGHENISQAYQARFLGAKGVWSPVPTTMIQPDEGDQPWIEIRDSQLKYHTPLDRPGVFEVVRTSDPRPPIDMTHQLLQILSNNGVATSVFSEMVERARENETEEFKRLELMSPRGLRKFLIKIDPAALEKEAKASALASDAGDVVKKRNFSSMEAEDLDLRKGGRQYLNEFTHCPALMSQRALALLDSGFNPEENIYFARLLLDLFGDTSGDTSGKAVCIPCRHSTNLIVVPDPSGTLEAGTIFYQSSQAFAQSIIQRDGRIQPGRMKQTLSGPCLVTRDPALLPTDVQKVEAVDAPALRNFMDVIVFSTKGSESLCSLLGGGDYDGDTVKLIWDPKVVRPFRNAPKFMAFAPADLEDVWIDSRHGCMSDEDKSFHLREPSEGSSNQISTLLCSTMFTPRQFGQLANMHTTAAYEKGLDHQDTRLLAYLFAIALDGGKSGKTVKDSKMRGLQKSNGRRFPKWARDAPMDRYQKYLLDDQNQDAVRKHNSNQPYVMDVLRDQFFQLATDQKATAVTVLSTRPFQNDACLRQYWEELQHEAEDDDTLLADLKQIQKHVGCQYLKYKSLNGDTAGRGHDIQSSPSKKRGEPRTGSYNERLREICEDMCKPLKLASARFTAFDGEEASRKYRASYLYDLCCQGRHLSLTGEDYNATRMKGPWIFFFRELANFKANQKSRELDQLRGGASMAGVAAQSFTDEAYMAVKRRRVG